MTAAAKILDPCCGSRMFWFDKDDQRALFGDIRDEEHVLCDGRVLKVEPNVIMDFRSLPFEADTFRMVVFDPPHLTRAGVDSWMRAKYGMLTSDWREDLRQGFAECFRVLEPEGILIFKWNETQVLVSELLALTDQKPLFGHKSGKREKTHWFTFMKRAAK
ncbi:class I SAM-dependent methyltransferase [Pseudomonas sp. RTB3]|uniref:class I SAM-dependent methyltransferase n=1 Tax=unclassified Pseudomonas TaxID=196821 RepID=UPI002B223F19|nr:MULTISPECIES: class I SAM-dependent methyltransferase [unclassified Pseudomonas]MEB0008176.1 class I SAM-dependent methyltransferase [Pseudomonas sp. RTB2]MEB0015898.1 class I SAM-dependent methyltransferase [Pseudomonas sp. RTB3]MEB0270888.1 class I SAM-dependent methyltransferase [Pseudomonas sp. 5B4]